MDEVFICGLLLLAELVVVIGGMVVLGRMVVLAEVIIVLSGVILLGKGDDIG